MKTIAFIIPTQDMPYIVKGQYNGYVAVPPGHPLWGKGYGDPEPDELDVHGGITYSDYAYQLPLAEAEPLKDGEIPHDWWTFGFDTCHTCDTPEKWTRENVAKETRHLQRQLEKMLNHKDLKDIER